MARDTWAYREVAEIGVEANAGLVDRLQPRLLQHVVQLLVDHQHALVEIVAFLGVIERAVEVVEDPVLVLAGAAAQLPQAAAAGTPVA